MGRLGTDEPSDSSTPLLRATDGEATPDRQAAAAASEDTAQSVRRRARLDEAAGLGNGSAANGHAANGRGACDDSGAGGGGPYESLDYEPIFNSVTAAERENFHFTRHFYGYTGNTLAKWLASILIGAATGAIAFVLEYSTTHGLLLKNALAFGAVRRAGLLAGFVVHAGSSLALVAIPFALVQFWAPEAAGAGVVLVMAYLNGNHIPDLLRFRTLAAKVVGTIAVVISGLAVGPEGPLVHVGAAVAHNLTIPSAWGLWLKSLTWKARLEAADAQRARRNAAGVRAGERPGRPAASVPSLSLGAWLLSKLPSFDLHSDTDQRDFVSAGAAAGLAAAFGAPIGGVLYALEEAASFWSRKTMWRCFLCASMSSLVLAQLHGRGQAGIIGLSGLVPTSSEVWAQQLPLFVLTAMAAGCLGALFTLLNHWLARVRAPLHSAPRRCAEVAGVLLLTIGLAWSLALAFGTCMPTPLEPLPPPPPGGGNIVAGGKGIGSGTIAALLGGGSSVARLPGTPRWQPSLVSKFRTGRILSTWGAYGVRMSCDEAHYNDLASLFFSVPETTIRRLFNMGELEATRNLFFTSNSLALFCAAYLVMMALASGVAVPGGLFMPSIMLGSAFGRLIGHFVKEALPAWPIQPGLYALIGGTATLAGVFRSSISLVVIVVEGTGGIDFLFTIVLAVIASNSVAHYIFKHGLYEADLARRTGITFLHAEPPRELRALTAADIASRHVVGFPQRVTARELLSVLQSSAHNGFPVFEDDTDAAATFAAAHAAEASGRRFSLHYGRRLEGLILRSQVLVLLQHWAYTTGVSDRPHHGLGLAALESTEPSSASQGGSPPRPAAALGSAAGAVAVARALGDAESAPDIGPELERWLEHEMRTFHHRHFLHRRQLSAAPGNAARIVAGWEARDPLGWAAAEALAESTGGEPPSGYVGRRPTTGDDAPCDEGGGGHRVGPGPSLGAGADPLDAVLNLRPFMNHAPLTVREECSAARVYRMFGALGLRHLCVVDDHNYVIGIVTRKDLEHDTVGDAATGGGE